MTWTITDHGDESYTVSALTTLDDIYFICSEDALANRVGIYAATEAQAIDCIALEHVLRAHGAITDAPSGISTKLVAYWGDLDQLRIPARWIDSDFQERATAGTLNVGWGSGVPLATHDLLVAFISVGSTTLGTVATPSGWTALRDDQQTGVVRRVHTYVFTRYVPASYTPSTDFVSTGATIDGMTGEVHVVRDANRVTPIGSVHAANTLTGVDPTSPSVNLNNGFDRVVIAHLAHNHGATSRSHTPNSGYTERQDGEASGAVILGSCSQTKTFVGSQSSTGAITFDCTDTVTADYVGITVAIGA